jgi:voltage-gated potassium channel
MELTDLKATSKDKLKSHWRLRLHEIIFEADTAAGRAFDVTLLILILSSVMVVMLESVASIESEYGKFLRILEWAFTIIFTIEYFARIITIGKPVKYIFSFLGTIDLLAIIPTYLSFFITGSQFLLVFRTFRLLRVFRIFKLARYLTAADSLLLALKASRFKITVFLGTVISLVIISGTVMYIIEGPENGFTSIPQSIYWSIVTLTTVGYGDIAPRTILGQMVASLIMIMGYGIIAVPTGIVTVEMANLKKDEKSITTQSCPQCSKQGHDHDAVFCKYCGGKL